jgi:hypothetical protein
MNSGGEENRWRVPIHSPAQIEEGVSPYFPGLLEMPFTTRQCAQSLHYLAVISDATHDLTYGTERPP